MSEVPLYFQLSDIDLGSSLGARTRDDLRQGTLTPNTGGLIPTLGALSPQSGPVQDPPGGAMDGHIFSKLCLLAYAIEGGGET